MQCLGFRKAKLQQVPMTMTSCRQVIQFNIKLARRESQLLMCVFN